MHGEVPVQERQVFIHHLRIIVVSIEAPHAGLAVADGAPVQRTIGLAEAEIGVRTLVVAHLAGEGDDIGAIHGLAVRGNAEAQFLIGLLRLGELADAADAVVGYAAGHPYRTLAAGTLADEFHDPGLVLVTHRRFAKRRQRACPTKEDMPKITFVVM